MCGIAGVVAWDDKFRTSRETLAKMSGAIAHRGPDGEGIYFNHEAEVTPDRPQCALAHQRLAIIDPDPRSNEPFPSADRSKWLVFNGEIYNYRELRAELTKLRPEYQWRTSGDTEVLLVAYEQWGEKCVEHFNGMFAFAIWDEREKSLFLARDRMGQKPLYVAEIDGAIAFGSEASALLCLDWVNPAQREEGIVQYLRHGCTEWFYEGFRAMPQGWLGVRPIGKPGHDRYYFNADQQPGNSAPARRTIEEARDFVLRAVGRQLVSDVPLGVFLSGGVDSSIIAAAARRQGPVQTFSIAFDDDRYDESAFAKEVARHLGTEHHEFKVTPRAAEDLPMLAKVFGEPFADSSALPTHYLSRETRKHVKVALSGDGGDELFGGYDRYRAMRADWVLRLIPAPARRAGAWLPGALFSSPDPKSRASKWRRFLLTAGVPAANRYVSYLRIFDDATIAELLPRDADQYSDDWLETYQVLAQNRDALRAALALDRATYLPDDLLTKLDRASMLHNLEVRSPFMDHELVEFAAGLTTDQLLRGGPKRMLREAFAQDLPAWVFKRKKMGFAVPIGEWFRSSLKEMLHDNLFASDSFGATHFNMDVVRRLVEEHEQNRVDHSQRLYALLMLELWWRTMKP